jgi:protein-L-isoaspartate(D-aspartate) O-methyltransferase
MKLITAILLSIMWKSAFSQVDPYLAERIRMINSQLISRGISNNSVLNAMRKVPRHLFVPKNYRDQSYNDNPLSIGYNQTISQPYIVAYMTEMAKPGKHKRALEIGTGSGYQAAVLAELVDSVYTIEIIPELAEESATRLKVLGYDNILVKFGDGYNGWPEHAPFDIILVTAAPEKIPEPLINQLADGGRLIVPVGKRGSIQELILVEKKKEKIEKRVLNLVRFVPFKRLDK